MEEHIGELQLGNNNKRYKVMRCETHFLRHHNVHYPDANPICDKIRLTIRLDNNSDLTIHDWYINQTYIDCKFYYNQDDNDRCLELKFSLCYSMKEVYDINEDSPLHLLVIELFPTQAIINNDTTFDLQ